MKFTQVSRSLPRWSLRSSKASKPPTVLSCYCVLVLLLLFNQPAPIAQGSEDIGKRKITLNLANEDLQSALMLLFHAAHGVRYKISPDLDLSDAHVAISMTDVPLDSALQSLLRCGRASGKFLVYHVKNGVYNIAVGDPKNDPRRVTLTAVKEDLGALLKRLFEQADVKYEIDKGVIGTVTVTLTDSPLFNIGLWEIIHHANTTVPITYRMDKGVYQVLPILDPRVQADICKDPISIAYESSDLRYALKYLFNMIHANYTLDQHVVGTVSLTLRDVPFRDAIDQILKASGVPLTWRMEDRVYNVISADPKM
jgi:type II secretory pathway component GspD/PulD (secretin)